MPFDARPALKDLAQNNAGAWKQLWENLHHQGDVGEASYAAIPHVINITVGKGRRDWNTFALAATIEECRRSSSNPLVPDWLVAGYKKAWDELVRYGLELFPDATDREVVESILQVLSLSKGMLSLARLLTLTEDERAELLKQADAN